MTKYSSLIINGKIQGVKKTVIIMKGKLQDDNMYCNKVQTRKGQENPERV
jgi:hypothetical protein